MLSRVLRNGDIALKRFWLPCLCRFYSSGLSARRSRFGRKIIDEKKSEEAAEVKKAGLKVDQPTLSAADSPAKAVTEPVTAAVLEVISSAGIKPKSMPTTTPHEPKHEEDWKSLRRDRRNSSTKKEIEKTLKADSKQSKKSEHPKKSHSPAKKAIKKRRRETKVKLDIPSFLSVSNLATILKVRVPELLERLNQLGFENMSNDYILDGENAALIAEEFGFEVNQDDALGADLFPSSDPKDTSNLKTRSPVVTIMGHVDHGKTTILDFFRKSSIVSGEAGGITQHIGAFVVKTKASARKITFLDTPGHAAFLKMRERGANMTDLVILVVAAEDSVKPQTIEAIKHTKNAGVPMIVAINKCDKEDANPDKVVADLSRNGVDVEDYGGEVPVIRVSGKTGMGMSDLEDAIVTVADLLELKGEDSLKTPVEGWILESEIKKGLGNCATFLVKKGKLKKGMFLVAGTTWCKVRVMQDENGKSISVAGPSTPVEISGWRSVPEAGDFAIQSKDEAYAKKVIGNRERRNQRLAEADQVDEMNSRRMKQLNEAHRKTKIQEYQNDGFTLEEMKELDPDLFDDGENDKKFVTFIVKGDVSGSSEAVRQSIEGLGNDEIAAKIIYDDVGPPTESDIERAKSSDAQILVFNLKIPKDIANKASSAGVELKEFNVIYHLIEDVVKTLTNNLPQKFETKVLSKASVRQLFEITLKGKEKIVIAGSRISDGVFKRSGDVRLVRDGEEIFRGKVKQLKVQKDDVQEVKNGGDCGIALEGSPEILVGDIIEAVKDIPIERHL